MESGISTNLAPTAHLVIDHLKRLENRAFGQYALYIQMSKLQPDNRKPHHFRTINETFKELTDSKRGKLYSLINDDFIFFYDEHIKDEVEAFKVKFNFMFADDPLLANYDDDNQFIIDGNLSKDIPNMIEMVKEASQFQPSENPAMKNEIIPEPPKTEKKPQITFITEQKPKGSPLTPAMLAKVEKSLLNTDFANMIRRQSVCAIVGKAMPQSLFDEVFVSITDLRETILPNVNFILTPWLFQHMTETLDKKVLSNINKHDDGTLNGNFSINLNVSTVLSNDFLTFDDNINASMRSTIVIEMQPVDIFSDLSSYILARDFAKERGYRICIDGISVETMPYIDRLKLGADMVKIIWNQELASAVINGPSALDNIKRIGGGRIIFCRIDDNDAIEAGQKLGVTMFQGRHVQRLLLSDLRKKRIGTVMVRK
ncbi:MAG: hypothetical protein AB7U85_09390 [Alphaproteobacteria bacterium]